MSQSTPAERNIAPSQSSGSSETSDPLDMKNEDGWEDAESDHESLQFVSLLDEQIFTDIKSMLEHCRIQHDFDFLALRQRLKLDFYGSVKLINFIRSQTRDGAAVTSDIHIDDFADEKYLKPVLEDDALIFNLDELPEVETNNTEKGKAASQDASALVARVSELEEELRKMQTQFDNYRATVSETLDQRWNDRSGSGQSSAGAAPKEEKRDDDTHYFSSYSYNDIHETMLKDTVRTDAYRDFIYNNKSVFQGKTVLDVGCGTGILSMFCAKAGAKRVIAVDNSAIIDKARENIFNNGFADQITLLRGKVEEVVLPVDKVDIIVSEWMGYCLLYEAMLDSVIWARDKYLRPDGLMVPSHMNMWIGPVADPDYISDHIAFWRDIYGFDMKAMQAGIHEDAQVLDMPSKTVCAEPYPFLQLSLYTTSVKDLSFKRPWSTKLGKDIDALDGFIIWFDTFFLPSRDDIVPTDAKAEDWEKTGPKGNAFTTGPGGKVTHWKQGVLLIDNTKEPGLPRKEGTALSGELEYAVAEDNSRALNISVKWKFEDNDKEEAQAWKMR